MSNQIQITGGAKVRSLEGVITGTSGVLSSLPINTSNGIPQLDVNGKILVSQLPNSVMEYKGTWNAATNTPTLADGTGNQGDVYLCNVAGTVNFGSGPIQFYVGDQVIYSGTIWQRASGASGTVTSVGLSSTAGAFTITNSPITTSGNIGLNFAGNSGQYVAGDGSLVTFPSIITQAQNLVTEVYNETGATLSKGTVVYINGGHGNLPTVAKAIATSDATSAQTYGVVRADITNNNNGYVTVIGNLDNMDTQAYANGTQLYLSSTTAGAYTSVKQYAPAHLVYVGIVTRSHPTQGVIEVKIQNGYELDELHNVSAQTPSNGNILQYVTSTGLWTAVAGTTTNIAEGTNLYYTDARSRAAFSESVTGLDYNSTTGVLSTTSGYGIPTTIKQSNWDDAYTWVAAFPTQTGNSGKFLTTDGSTLSWAANPLGTVTSVAMSVPTGLSVSGSPITSSGTLAVTFAAGYSIPTNASQTNWDTAYTNRITSLTTTGSSGSATLVSNTLNIPTYTLSGLGGVPTSRTLTINGVSYDLSADRTWSITAGISSVSGTAPISVTTVSGAATVSISQATTSTNGYLSSTDWNTFNNKQNALTNPVTATGGAIGQVAFFTGTNTIDGESNLFWDSSNNRLKVGAISSTYSITSENGLQLGDGSGSAINFNSNSGYQAYIRVAGNDRITIVSATGRVGINTTNVNASLEVKSDTANEGSLRLYNTINNAATAWGLEWFRDYDSASNSSAAYIKYTRDGGSSGNLIFGTGTVGSISTAFTIASNAATTFASSTMNIGTSTSRGNVTIEQTTTNAGLVINSSIAESPKLYLRDAGGVGYSELQANNNLYINATRITIGTTNDYGKLTIGHNVGSTRNWGSSGTANLVLWDTTTSQIGVGGAMVFSGYKSTANATGFFAAISGVKENTTNGNEQGAFVVYNSYTSAGAFRENFRITSGGVISANANYGGGGNRVIYTDNTGNFIAATVGTGLSLSGGVLSATGGGSGTVSGSGTSGYIAKWTGTSAVGNSQIYDDGTSIILGNTSATASFKNTLWSTSSSNTTVIPTWPYYAVNTQTMTRYIASFTDGGNGGTSTAGTGTTAYIEIGQYYTGRGVISMSGSGGSSPADQGTGRGKDLLVIAGQSDNTAGYVGGRLYLQGGSGYSGGYGQNYGAVILQSLGGLVGIGMTPSYGLDVSTDIRAGYSFRATSSGSGLYLSGGSNRIYFSSYRAMEGATDGSTLQIGEGYANTLMYNIVRIDGNSVDKPRLNFTYGSVDVINMGDRTTSSSSTIGYMTLFNGGTAIIDLNGDTAGYSYMNAGNVVIGSNTQIYSTAKLQVSGNMYVSGSAVYMGGVTYASTQTFNGLVYLNSTTHVAVNQTLSFDGTSAITMGNTGSELYMVGNILLNGAIAQYVGFAHTFQGSSTTYNVQLLNSNISNDELTIQGGVRLNSSTAGFIPPRMTTTQLNALSARGSTYCPNGTTIFDTTINILRTWNGSAWMNLW